MTPVILCMDVGGTEIKIAPVAKSGRILTAIRHFPAQAQLPAEPLLDHFAACIRETLEPLRDITISGLHMAFPGPFDYEKGICRIQQLHKYDALYGRALRPPLLQRFPELKAESIRFINDASAFALGEMRFGAVKADRAIYICIGTGCGSAFGLQGELAEDGVPGVPPQGYIYNTPFLDGCIDDSISRRGLLRLTEEKLGVPLDGLGLAQRAASGDSGALACFLQFGEWIRDALIPFLQDYHPDTLCIGGQIVKSAVWFLEPLEKYCNEQAIRLYTVTDTSYTIIQGLSAL